MNLFVFTVATQAVLLVLAGIGGDLYQKNKGTKKGIYYFIGTVFALLVIVAFQFFGFKSLKTSAMKSGVTEYLNNKNIVEYKYTKKVLNDSTTVYTPCDTIINF